jgi:hypothetical protein
MQNLNNIISYYLYEANAGLNSVTLHNKGKRYVRFKDQLIEYNFATDQYNGTLMGAMKVEVELFIYNMLNSISA